MTFQFHKQWKNPETGRTKKHVYLFDGKQMTGVTTVLDVISKPALIGWAARMAVERVENGGVLSDDLLTIKDWPTVKIEALAAHTKKKDEGADKGKDLHSEVEAYIKLALQGLSPDSDYKISSGLSKFIEWSKLSNIKFLSSETPTYSKTWFVAGTPDFTFEKDGKKYIGDLKTYKKIWDRVPHFQTAAYLKMLTENGEKYDGTCIVNINKEMNELTESWSYDFESDIEGFEAALKLYRKLNQ